MAGRLQRIVARGLAGAALVLLAARGALAQPPPPGGPAQPGAPQAPARPASPQGPATPWAGNPAGAIERPQPTAEQRMQLPVVLHLPGDEGVTVRRDIVYRTVAGRPLRLDLYVPAAAAPAKPSPAIVFASGAADARSWGQYTSYGRLAALQGFAGIVYEKRGQRSELIEAADDTGALFDWLREHGREIGVDPSRLVLWGFSGGGALLGVGIDARRPEIRALIGFYPALDQSNLLPFYPDSLRAVLKRTASPADILESRPLALPPTLIARAGLDDPLLNSGVMRFFHLALDAGRPIELINVALGRHGFDILDDDENSRRAIRRAFAFAKEQTESPTVTPMDSPIPGQVAR